jgi:hypothetical protein
VISFAHMVRTPMLPEIVTAAEVVTALLPEEGLTEGSITCPVVYGPFLDCLATFFTTLTRLAMSDEAVSGVREAYLAAIEKLNSHPSAITGCLARVEGRAFCNAKLTATRAGKESKRCQKHAGSDLMGVVLNQHDSHPACMSVCPACTGAFKEGCDVLMCACCEQQHHPACVARVCRERGLQELVLGDGQAPVCSECMTGQYQTVLTLWAINPGSDAIVIPPCRRGAGGVVEQAYVKGESEARDATVPTPKFLNYLEAGVVAPKQLAVRTHGRPTQGPEGQERAESSRGERNTPPQTVRGEADREIAEDDDSSVEEDGAGNLRDEVERTVKEIFAQEKAALSGTSQVEEVFRHQCECNLDGQAAGVKPGEKGSLVHPEAAARECYCGCPIHDFHTKLVLSGTGLKTINSPTGLLGSTP